MNLWRDRANWVGPYPWAWLPIPVFLFAIIGLRIADLQTPHEFTYLLLFWNLTILALAGLLVTILFARSFLRSGTPGLLFIACGAAVWGASGAAGVLSSLAATRGAALDSNVAVTVHNLCIWAAAILHLTGAASLLRWGGSVRARRSWLAGAGIVTAIFIGFILFVAMSHWLPVFFVPGTGGTTVRQFLLGSTIITLFLIVTLLRAKGSRPWAKFIYWYTAGQMLLADGYLGVMLQANFGDALSWAGRTAQYLGGIYMVVAAIAVFRERSAGALVLVERRIGRADGYGFAIAVVLAATILRLVFLQSLGTQVSFLTYYPAIVLSALYGGVFAGLAATILSAALSTYFFMPPANSLHVLEGPNLLALTIFVVSCILMSWVAGKLQKAARIFQDNEFLEREVAARTKDLAHESLRLQTLLETASDGIHVLDFDGKLVQCSRSFLHMLGYSPEEAATLNIRDWDAKFPPDELIRSVRAHILERTAIETRHRRKDGTVFDVEIASNGVELDGKPFLFASARDITERKRAINVLRESEERFRNLANTTPAFVWISDTEKRPIWVNQRWLEFAGLGLNEDLGNAWIERVHPRDLQRCLNTYAEAFDRRAPFTMEYRAKGADGDYRWIVDQGVPRIDPDGQFIGYVGSGMDITDRKNAEQALVSARETAEKSSQAKSQFLTLMSHELRTPLNGILGFAQLIDGEHFGQLNAKQKEFVDAILVSGRHLYELINDILELSKIEAGRMTIALEEVDLVPLVKSVVANLQQAAAAAGVDLIAGNCGLGLPPVHADRVRLAQCLFNLGSNAIKYNRPGGSVTFAYAREGERVRISVIDTGIGIPPDRQAELFQPFNRLGAEQKAIEGTGVGLALTRRLIDLMGGGIGFTSTFGKGSHFWLDIPVSAASQEEPPPTAERIAVDAHVRAGCSVLYVEDNPSNLELMRHVLATRKGVRLIEATNGADGLAMAKLQHPDLIILDINLPDTNGIALLKVLKDLPEFAATPILALSANAMPRDIEEGLDAGFFDYITKPLDVTKFLAAIDAALSSTCTCGASTCGDREAEPAPCRTFGG